MQMLAAEEDTESQNLALNRPITASDSESGSEAQKAVDGDSNSWWTTVGPAWIQVDLESICKIDRINLMAWFNPDEGHANRYYEYKFLAVRPVKKDPLQFLRIIQERPIEPGTRRKEKAIRLRMSKPVTFALNIRLLMPILRPTTITPI
ncbi:MAG: discoidin domain-containing protein [Allobaculum sp.]|uniref:discoidin domain-containing protein n=2 Tax=Allobaculum TaxID=174708 RepID=UPI00399AADBC